MTRKIIISKAIYCFIKTTYGKKITISFLQRIRDIQKFTAKEELAERISLDVEFALKSKL